MALSELGNVDHAESPSGIPNPNLFHTLTHGVHWFPVVRLLAVLHLIELMTGLALGRERKGAKVTKRTAPDSTGLGSTMAGSYKVLYVLTSRLRRHDRTYTASVYRPLFERPEQIVQPKAARHLMSPGSPIGFVSLSAPIFFHIVRYWWVP